MSAAEAADAPERDGAGGGEKLPEASFTLLLRSLELQAHIAFGDIESPVTGRRDPDPARAKFQIDMLQVLKDKTAGRLSDAEDHLITDLLYLLRTRYVALFRQS